MKNKIRALALMVVIAAASGCDGGDPPAVAPVAQTAENPPAQTEVDVTAPNLQSNDTDYLARLGLIRGHLLVGTTLYRDGAVAAAKLHMKHPADELYVGLGSAFDARGTEGFADALEALASAVESEAPVAEVETRYQQLTADIAMAEQALNGELDVALRRRVIATLLGHAADEYGVGVVDGEVVEPHEYQDAWGFTQIALGYAEGSDTANGQLRAAAAAIEGLDPLWPDLVAERVEAGGAAQIAAVTATLASAPETG